MSIKEKILELLSKEDLTSAEIIERLDIKADNVWVHLYDLNRKNKVVRITYKKPYVYKSITPKAYLRRLYNFMSDEKKCELKELNESDIIFLTEIKETIN